MTENSNKPTDSKLIHESDTITRIHTNRGTIILLGTAHVSEDSVKEVEETIKSTEPQLVCIELDENRYRSLNEENKWKNLNIYQIIKEKKAFLLLSSLILSSYQKRLGLDLGANPGDEMRAAANTAGNLGVPISMIDRDISVTLSRAWRKTGFWGKNKLMAVLLNSSFSREKLDQKTIENLKQRSVLDDMMTELAGFLPTIKDVLINERDEYLAIKIWEHIMQLSEQAGAGQEEDVADKAPVVLAVVGAGHVPGMVKKIQEFDTANSQQYSSAPGGTEDSEDSVEHSTMLTARLGKISEIPPPGILNRLLPWLLFIAVFALIISGFITGGLEGGLQKLLRWVLINGSLSAIGAVIALAHPVTIISSFLAAPITSMNPTIGVGFVTGLLESFLRKPRVQDFESLGDDITNTKGFFRNRITHILLVFLFSSIGSAIGTFVALPLLFP